MDRVIAHCSARSGVRKLVLLLLAGSTLCLLACPPAKKRAETQPVAPAGIPLEEAARPTGGATVGETLGGYPRFPDLHGEVVVFAAEGDLWQSSIRGGLARRITSHPGNELFPHFSPDGKLLAFSGDYDGNQDVFVMPSVGGVPRRLTFHPAIDQVLGWTAKGDAILFRSQRDHPHGDWTLYTISPEGGDPRRLPLSRAARLAYEPGGERVAINLTDRDFRRWKRYAGGTSAQLYLGDLKGGAFRKLTSFRGTNAYPMWHGGRIYFLSDRTGTENIWSITPEGQELRQHTRFDDYDVRFPSLGDGRIVFQQRAELHLLDLKSGEVRPIQVRLISDALSTRTRFTDPVRFLRRFELTPDGKYLGLEIRGNLHLIPAAKEGRRIQVSRGSASRQQGISFSDDGKQIASTSDASGEIEVTIFDSRGVKEPRQLTHGGARFKHPPVWAPGGRWIAYAESDNRLYIVPSEKGEPRLVDHSPYNPITDYAFSPDGRWLAYAKVEENYFSSIFLYDCEHKRTLRITEASFDDWSPTWSTDGKYLGFLSDRTINPFLDRLDQETIIDRATKPYLVLLAQKTRSPFLPRDPEADDEIEKRGKAQTKRGEKAKRPTVTVDADGIGERIVELPVPAGNLHGLHVGEDAILYLSQPSRGMNDWEKIWWGEDEPTGTLMRFDLKKKKEEKLAEAIVSFKVSRDGKQLVLRKKKTRLYAFKLAEKAPKEKELAEHALPLPAIREPVDPRAEWRQIYNEVWRMMRDFYFAEDMGKVDWPAIGKKYAALLDRIASREELEDLLGELVAELSLGHTYIWGGDLRPVQRVPVGLLGADLEPDAGSGRYRFKRIYAGASWDSQRLSPLLLSHARVREGDYLLKIDGRPLRIGENPYSRLQRAAGELVQLTVSSDGGEARSREVEITTLKNEGPVRYYAWVKQNRERVAAKTQGQVGYLHLPDMMTAGMVEFDRWYYPQVRKAGLIIDGRWNRGGFISQIVIKRLTRTILSWSKSRNGWVGPYPQNTLNGRIVVLTNERAGSDGDIFARAIQVGKVGPVIGTRTWGGVVGINLSHPLVDKGVSTRPGYFAWWEPDRGWRLEGEGVTPDLVVENDPAAEFRGTDAQLEKGIETMLELLRKNPPRPPAFGESPDKRKETWVKTYGQTSRP